MDRSQLKIQHDFYKLLLEIGEEPTTLPDEYLSRALALVVELTGADLGYVELKDAHGKTWWSTHQCRDDDLARIRDRISSSIIADAIAAGETIVTPSAFLDPRFKKHDSVQTGRIDAVLCAPMQEGDISGAVYLHKYKGDYTDSENNIMNAELFTKHVSPLLKCLKQRIFPSQPKRPLEDFIGASPAFEETLKEMYTIANLDVTVLLKGETGVGKTRMARLIHENSPRRKGPFVHLNCANLQENLLESELFGAVRGSHSGAYNNQTGKITSAANGTLFLDEIGELPLKIQSKLLQFLEEGTYYPLGALQPEKPDVRITIATNIDFSEAIRNQRFREDLYYRIAVFPITIPPLRKRREDIPALTHFFLRQNCRRFDTPEPVVPQTIMRRLYDHDWPGNIRQLENAIQRAVLLAMTDSADTLDNKHLADLAECQQPQCVEGSGSYREEKNIWEKQFLQKQLAHNQWNISKTAKELGLSRAHMNNLVKSHGLQREM